MQRPRRPQMRRILYAFAGVGAAAFFIPRLAFGEEKQGQTPDVAATDRQRILTAADRYLREEPVTITASFSPRSAGGKHDYCSSDQATSSLPRKNNHVCRQRFAD